jgi:hypothetical protein
MQLILAIDSDPRRSEQLASLVHAKLRVDLVQATSAGEGLHTLKDRIPDLILTPPLLSPFDDGVLDEYLRDLGAAGAHVQTVRIPVLSAEPRKKAFASRLFVLGLNKVPTSAATPDGCDPMVFADEIAVYLARAADARRSVAQVAEALSRHEQAMARPQEPLPPSPVAARATVADTTVVNEAFIAEFADAIEQADAEVVQLADAEVIELRYVEASEPAPEMTSGPTYVEPSASPYVKVSASSYTDEPRETAAPIVDPIRKAEPIAPPEPIRKGPKTSDSFEAALAAIRAAWVKPDEPAAQSSLGGSPTPRSTAQSDSDRRPVQDEFGVFDADQCGFPALVDKIDEVAESKEKTPRPSVTTRVISIR